MLLTDSQWKVCCAYELSSVVCNNTVMCAVHMVINSAIINMMLTLYVRLTGLNFPRCLSSMEPSPEESTYCSSSLATSIVTHCFAAHGTCRKVSVTLPLFALYRVCYVLFVLYSTTYVCMRCQFTNR